MQYIRGSLFDRLIDWSPHEPETSPALKTLTLAELKDSIHREVSWLLNTMCSYSSDEIDDMERSTLNYGMHDFSSFFPDNNDNRRKLSKVVGDLINVYEPRLQNVNVEVDNMNNGNDKFSLSLVIEAEMVIDKINEPVTFIMAIN